jgi:hypothetical protein
MYSSWHVILPAFKKHVMKKLSILVSCALFATSALLFNGCKKDDTHPTSTLVISMKDAPAAYDEVNVEVIEIQVHTDADGWITVPVTDSIYNLLLLQGNNATFLANTVIPSGTLSQVRLILGEHNSVVVGGTSYPLLLSSEDETGLKLNIHQNLIGGVTYDLLLDFHADESVLEEGNGSYRLKPVMTAEFL